MTYSFSDPPPIRQARLRPEAADRYPWAPADRWMAASRLADQAMTEATRQGRAAPRARVLPGDAFEFRGGRAEYSLCRRAHTRWSDQVYPGSAMQRPARI
jgi:hypothetical protein